MTDRELSGRRRARSLGVKEVLEERDYPEEQYQCNYCKAFCYLSQIYCTCAKSRTTKVVCLEHIDYLCECDMSDRTLRLRFSDEELSNTQQTIESSAAIPDSWGDKFTRLLEESPRPSLRALRALVAGVLLRPVRAARRRCGRGRVRGVSEGHAARGAQRVQVAGAGERGVVGEAS